MGKNLPTSAGDVRDVCSIPGSGRSPGDRNGNPVQYSCLKNPIDRGAWKATVHGVAKLDRTEWLSTQTRWKKEGEETDNFEFSSSVLPSKVKLKLFSRVGLFVTPWTVADQAPPSMEFSRQGYWSGLPFPSPGALPDPGMEPRSPALQADTLTF